MFSLASLIGDVIFPVEGVVYNIPWYSSLSADHVMDTCTSIMHPEPTTST